MYSCTVSRPQPARKSICLIFYFALFTRAAKLLPTLIWLCACMLKQLSVLPPCACSQQPPRRWSFIWIGTKGLFAQLETVPAPDQTRSDVQPEPSHADPCPVMYHTNAVGTSIKMGCASVVSTHLSSGNAPGSPNISHRYLRVSASQKLSMPLSGTAGTFVASCRNTSSDYCLQTFYLTCCGQAAMHVASMLSLIPYIRIKCWLVKGDDGL